MNLCNHLQIISVLLIGGWWVYTDRLEVGGVVALISGISRLNDPWGDLGKYFSANLMVYPGREVSDQGHSGVRARPLPLDRYSVRGD